jgi:hypothetical protein
MSRRGLAAPDRSNAAKQVHVAPTKISNLDYAACSRDREHRHAMCVQPFRFASRRLQQLSLGLGRKCPPDRLLTVRKCLDVL